MRVPRWCLSLRTSPFLLLSLMPLKSSAGEPTWDPAYGYAPAQRQSSGGAAAGTPHYVQGSRDPYAAGGARKGLSSGAQPPSLYETLRRDPGLGRAPSGHIETPAPPPRPDPERYRFRGDGPLDAAESASASDYRYRPLTTQERDRGQATSGWRPVTAPRRESPTSPVPSRPSTPPDRQTSGGWPQVQPPYPELPGPPNQDAENWFDRHYGVGRR